MRIYYISIIGSFGAMVGARLKQRLNEYSMTLHSEIITRLDVDQMTKAQSSRGESVEQVAQRLIRMCDFAYSRGWFSKWGPQLMELIHNHAFIKQELGPIATQIAHAIQVPPRISRQVQSGLSYI